MKELYRVSGWYSWEVFISSDGRYLVQLGPWSVGDRPEPADLAVAFFKDGKLLKSYSTDQMLQDPLKIEKSVSHYVWRNHYCPCSLGSGDIFSLHTIDGWTIEFDATTGEIKRRRLFGSDP
jgi:hypothetical protein